MTAGNEFKRSPVTVVALPPGAGATTEMTWAPQLIRSERVLAEPGAAAGLACLVEYVRRHPVGWPCRIGIRAGTLAATRDLVRALAADLHRVGLDVDVVGVK